MRDLWFGHPVVSRQTIEPSSRYDLTCGAGVTRRSAPAPLNLTKIPRLAQAIKRVLQNYDAVLQAIQVLKFFESYSLTLFRSCFAGVAVAEPVKFEFLPVPHLIAPSW